MSAFVKEHLEILILLFCLTLYLACDCYLNDIKLTSIPTVAAFVLMTLAGYIIGVNKSK